MKQVELIVGIGVGLASIWAVRKLKNLISSKTGQQKQQETFARATVDWASVSLANQRIGHGFKCHLKGKVLKPVNAKRVHLNIWGDFAKGLPVYASTVVDWVLPLHLRFFDASPFSDEGDFDIEFGLGLYKLSHGTLDRVLSDQVAAGNPVLLFEMIAEDENGERSTLCEIPFRCSDFKNALHTEENRPDIIYRGNYMPNFEKSRGSPLWNWFSWLIAPISFNGFIWYIHKNVELVKELCFNIVSTHKLIKDVLPPIPSNMGEAWLWGKLQGQIESFDRYIGNAEETQKLLAEAAKLLGRAKISKEEFANIYKNIVSHELSQGITTRVWGFFSFVNIMWLLAIAGITISIGPAIYHLTEPLRKLLKRIAEWIYDNIIYPTVRFCHENYVFESVGYLVCLNFIIEGMNLPHESGTFVALTGYILTTLAFSYTTFLRGGKAFATLSDESRGQLLGFYFALLFAPGAVFFQSQLLGWASVISLYMALGFNIQCRGLCWLIGWSDKDALLRTLAASLLLMIYFIQMSIMGTMPTYLVPFASACTIFGSIASKLGLLIISSTWQRDTNFNYWKHNTMMISLLLASSAIGNIYGLNGLANTSTTFIVIYFMEKYVEWYVEMEWNGWVLMLSISSFLYKAALYLHQNPEFVASLFDHTSKAPVKNLTLFLRQ